MSLPGEYNTLHHASHPHQIDDGQASEDTRLLEYGTGIRSDPFSQSPAGAEPWIPMVVDFCEELHPLRQIRRKADRRPDVQHHTPYLPEIDGPGFDQRTLLRYLTIATNDAVLFNAIIAFTSIDLAAKQPHILTHRHALFLKGRALKSINTSLSDPIDGIKDSTIAAVVIMAGLEAIYHDLECSKAHMRGARRMIQLRGGLNALGYGGMFKRMFVYVDVANSLVTHERFFEDLEEVDMIRERADSAGRPAEAEIDAPGSTALVGFLPRPRGKPARILQPCLVFFLTVAKAIVPWSSTMCFGSAFVKSTGLSSRYHGARIVSGSRWTWSSFELT